MVDKCGFLIIIAHHFEVGNDLLKTVAVSGIAASSVSVYEVDMEVIVSWLVVEIGLDLLGRQSKLLFNSLVGLLLDASQKRQVLCAQVPDRLAGSDLGQRQQVEGQDISLVVIASVRLEHKVLVFEDSVLDLLVAIKDVEDPVEGGHIHHVDEVGLYYSAVNLGSFFDLVHVLLGVLVDQVFCGGVDEFGHAGVDSLSHSARVLTENIVVEGLLGVLEGVSGRFGSIVEFPCGALIATETFHVFRLELGLLENQDGLVV